MILHITCEIRHNVKIGGYTAVDGKNRLTLMDESENQIDTYTADVLWSGSGSPYPTPPGGPWPTSFLPAHSRFGRCFFVHSDRESEIFIHFAQKKSYGCFIIKPDTLGRIFMDILIKNKDDLKVIHHNPVDNRSDKEKDENVIDYLKMINKIT